ncbi:MAG: tRNA (N6-isopentenyl adenosine(37)-C2)-methylthiotransferase MiaB [Clostridia bacterium]|nr:tRNA (N6-isopentenyl adenosine(37)-C2)-methylthiotransferase MiaB [Clostridia bacterium]
MKFYKIITYGCQMNVHDSEKLSGMLEDIGYNVTEETEKADVIVFNTCAIRQGAEDRAFGNIGNLKKLKKQKPDLIVAVCGCMTQQKERAEELKKTFPFVNIIFGTHNLYKFKDYLLTYQKNKKRILELFPESDGNEESANMYRTSGENAYVNIMYGCNNFCSYCIVPYVRGREKSRNHLDVINECKSCIEKGYKFITLLGQNVNSYNDGEYNFAMLMRDICKIEGDFRLKFMTSHPKDLTDEVIDCIAEEPKLCKTIHLPIQSGSNSILKTMNRRYTREHYLDLVKRIRQKIDGDISTDIIVGFPGETEKDFQDTLSLIKEVGFVQLFGYMYSRRSGTLADTFTNHVDYDIKNERVNILLSTQKELLKETEKKMIGRTFVAFSVEHKDQKTIMDLDNFKSVEVEGMHTLKQFYQVEIVDFKDNKLIAKIK